MFDFIGVGAMKVLDLALFVEARRTSSMWPGEAFAR